jgi:hypothetical protein
MKKLAIAAALAAGLGIGSFAAVHAKLPPAAPMSDADKAAKATKEAAAKAKEAEDLGKAQDRAVANYKKGKGIVEPKASPATTSGKKK